MANLPTAEDKARMVLRIFNHFGKRPGGFLQNHNFLTVYQKLEMQWADVNDGLDEAAKRGWIQKDEQGFIRLTESGFANI